MSKDIDIIRDALRNLEEQLPPQSLSTRIMQRIAQPVDWRTLFVQWLNRPITIPLTPLRLAVTATVLIALYSGSLFIHRPDESAAIKNTPIPLPKISNNSEMLFYFGRGLLAAGQALDALVFLQKAVMLVPDNPEYHFWLGIAHWTNGNYAEERSSYQESIRINDTYLPAILNMGNSFLQEGEYRKSRQMYKRVLSVNPVEKQALYNLALIYRQTGDRLQEEKALLAYLSEYRKGYKSLQCLQRLSVLKNYRFRQYYIGNQKIILDQELLLSGNLQAQYQEIEYLKELLHDAPGLQLDFVVFNSDPGSSARHLARDLQLILMRSLGQGNQHRLTMSWFDSTDPVCERQPDCSVNKSVMIIATPLTMNSNKREI